MVSEEESGDAFPKGGSEEELPLAEGENRKTLCVSKLETMYPWGRAEGGFFKAGRGGRS